MPAGLSGVIQLSTSFVHTCALKADSTVRCWGECSRPMRLKWSCPLLKVGGIMSITLCVHA